MDQYLRQDELDQLLDGFQPAPGIEERVIGTILPSGVLLLVLRGRTLGASSLAVIDRIEELVRQQSGNIVIDLSECAFLSSMAVAVLVRLAKSREDENAWVYFCCANEHVRKVLRLVGCLEVFAMRDDCESAVEEAVRRQLGETGGASAQDGAAG